MDGESATFYYSAPRVLVGKHIPCAYQKKDNEGFFRKTKWPQRLYLLKLCPRNMITQFYNIGEKDNILQFPEKLNHQKTTEPQWHTLLTATLFLDNRSNVFTFEEKIISRLAFYTLSNHLSIRKLE